MNKLYARIARVAVKYAVCRRIRNFFGSGYGQFCIHWLHHKDLLSPLEEIEDAHFIPVFNESDSPAIQSLQAYQFNLSISYKRRARTITGIYYRALEAALLRGFACSMGSEAEEAFYTYYAPATDRNPELKRVYNQMISLDKQNLLRTVFLTELDYLPADGRDYSEDLAGLLDYLEDPSRGECYLKGPIRIGLLPRDPQVILSVYQRAVCERFYRVGVPNILPASRRQIDYRTFSNLVLDADLRPGGTFTGRMVMSGPGASVFDRNGLRGVLYREEYSWSLRECRLKEFFEGEECTLAIKSIDWVRGRILLTGRGRETDPRERAGFPEVYSIANVRVVEENHCYMLGLYGKEFEVILPKSELLPDRFGSVHNMIGRDYKVMIYHKDRDSRLYGSIRKL